MSWKQFIDTFQLVRRKRLYKTGGIFAWIFQMPWTCDVEPNPIDMACTCASIHPLVFIWNMQAIPIRSAIDF